MQWCVRQGRVAQSGTWTVNIVKDMKEPRNRRTVEKDRWTDWSSYFLKDVLSQYQKNSRCTGRPPGVRTFQWLGPEREWVTTEPLQPGTLRTPGWAGWTDLTGWQGDTSSDRPERGCQQRKRIVWRCWIRFEPQLTASGDRADGRWHEQPPSCEARHKTQTNKSFEIN